MLRNASKHERMEQYVDSDHVDLECAGSALADVRHCLIQYLAALPQDLVNWFESTPRVSLHLEEYQPVESPKKEPKRQLRYLIVETRGDAGACFNGFFSSEKGWSIGALPPKVLEEREEDI